MSNKAVQLPDVAAAISATSAASTYVATANEYLQLVATVVAIVTGIYAIIWHRVRIKEVKKKHESESK